MRKSATFIMTLLCSLLTTAAWAQDTHWTVSPYDFQYDMTVYFDLTADGEAVTDYSDYEVAAFVGDECRGVGTFQTASSTTYGYLRVRSNQASGEDITFKVYVKSINMEVDVKDFSISFVSQSMQGMPSSPVVLNFEPYTPGDANGDGEINASDLALMRNSILGRAITSTFIEAAADANGDGEINAADLALTRNKILGR